MLQFRRFYAVKKAFAQSDLLAEFPEKMLFKKHKTPSHLYLIQEETAALIHKSLKPYLKRSACNVALELNPGIGLLTNKLLEHAKQLDKIVLIESLEHFMPNARQQEAQYPERVVAKHGDLINLWKLAYQDKIDCGNRVSELLQYVPKRTYDEEPNVLLFGAVGSYNFFKHLINSLVFQNSLLSLGRCEMYLVVPPPIYIHLTCRNEIGYLIYRATSMLFQMLFEYRFLTKVPREHFLPRQTEFTNCKGSKLGRIKSINPEYLYLVRIVPRRNIFSYCPLEDMQALWYFVKQNCISRRNRIIPNLEKLVPGCGPRLIINTQEPENVKQLYSDEDLKKLPQYSTPCRTLSTRDFFPNMNIFTQFGDLNASQVLTLFRQFRQWPEYVESSFLASLENSLLKMESSADESVDGIADEDDASNETSSLEDTLTDEVASKANTATITKQKRNTKTVN